MNICVMQSFLGFIVVRSLVSAKNGGCLLGDPVVPPGMELIMDTQCRSGVLQLAAWKI